MNSLWQMRQQLGLTKAELAAMLDCDVKLVQRMECLGASRRDPPIRVMRLMKAYLAGYRPPDWPKK